MRGTMLVCAFQCLFRRQIPRLQLTANEPWKRCRMKPLHRDPIPPFYPVEKADVRFFSGVGYSGDHLAYTSL